MLLTLPAQTGADASKDSVAVVIDVLGLHGTREGGEPSDATSPRSTSRRARRPADLEITDLAVGDGDEATAGSTAVVHYVGVAYSTGEEFDASWNRGEPFAFPLGAGNVIAGWDHGVVGMKVGGRRRLVIPPDLGYGDRGAGSVIAPGETLIFVVDLLDVR